MFSFVFLCWSAPRRRTQRSAGRLLRLGLALLGAVLLLLARPAHAQAPLRLVNDNTTVSEISFKFANSNTLRPDQLRKQIALTAPSFFDKVQRVLPLFRASPHPFGPVVLQKDVVRLRRYYRQNGFLSPEISYPASQLDTSSNTIHVILSIDEGPPLVIQDVGFFASDSNNYAVSQFEGTMRKAWINFRDKNTFQIGERFTEFEYLRIQSQVTTWLKDQGYAFAQIQGDSTINRQNYTADVRFFVDAGPRSRISEINIEGNNLVVDKVIRRELPFQVGDRFSSNALTRGEQDLFSLNLFTLAQIEVPDQPRDSTVSVTVRVRETEPRYLTAQTGYAQRYGVALEGRWTHRNFLGGARNFTASTTLETGFLSTSPSSSSSTSQFSGQANRRFRSSLGLRQPYLFSRNLSGVISPFFLWENDPLLQGREMGVSTTLLYELLPFRLLTFGYSFSRANVTNSDTTAIVNANVNDELKPRDLFNKSIFTLGGTLGRADNYLSPNSGFLLRPFAEFAGNFLASDVNYYKLGGEASVYRPLTGWINAAARVSGGRLFLLGSSQYNETDVFNEEGHIAKDPVLENRFDKIRFYAGGGSDVRGWGSRLLGPKVARADTLFERYDSDGDGENDASRPALENGEVQFTDFRYETLGGLSKLAVNLEARLPFPGLGPAWSTAAFLDFGQVAEGSLHPKDFRYGTGAGFRYETPVGHLRLDLAYKINPTRQDLLGPEEAFLENIGRKEADPSFWRRFQLHLSIGQTF